jgi:hypothetical protein
MYDKFLSVGSLNLRRMSYMINFTRIKTNVKRNRREHNARRLE